MGHGVISRSSFRPFLGLCLLVIALVGCSAVPKPIVELFEDNRPEESLSLRVMADSQVNPDLNGRPSPVVLRVYQLKRELQFRSSDFFALYDNDIKILADDLVGRTEYVINPGRALDLDIGVDPAARYVAFLGAFRDLDNAVAKVATAVDADDPESLHLLLTARQIKLLDDDAYEQLLEQNAAGSNAD